LLDARLIGSDLHQYLEPGGQIFIA
jgi:hypothetical protein